MNPRTLLALACCAALTACEKDDDDDAPANAPPAPLMRTIEYRVFVTTGTCMFNVYGTPGAIDNTTISDDTTFTQALPVGTSTTLNIYHSGNAGGRISMNGQVMVNCTQITNGVSVGTYVVQ